MRGARRAAAFFAAAYFVAAGAAGCGSPDEGPPDSGAGGSGVAGTGASSAGTENGVSGGAGGTGTAGSGTGGTSSAGTGTGGSVAGSGTAGSGTAGSSTAGSGSAEFSEVGVCGHRGEATVTDGEFSGFEEYFLIGEEGFGSDICVIRFDVERSGDPPSDCPDCEWSHQVRFSNPSVVLDENGVCENSELAFDADRIAEIDGSEEAYGYVDEFAGHVSVLMKYYADDELWDAFGTATYDPDESSLKFERRNGFCNYRP